MTKQGKYLGTADVFETSSGETVMVPVKPGTTARKTTTKKTTTKTSNAAKPRKPAAKKRTTTTASRPRR
jgi:hypothetical protein